MTVASPAEKIRSQSDRLWALLPEVAARNTAAIQFVIEELGPGVRFTAENMTKATALAGEFMQEIWPHPVISPDAFHAQRKKTLSVP